MITICLLRTSSDVNLSILIEIINQLEVVDIPIEFVLVYLLKSSYSYTTSAPTGGETVTVLVVAQNVGIPSAQLVKASSVKIQALTCPSSLCTISVMSSTSSQIPKITSINIIQMTQPGSYWKFP